MIFNSNSNIKLNTKKCFDKTTDYFPIQHKVKNINIDFRKIVFFSISFLSYDIEVLHKNITNIFFLSLLNKD